MTHDTVLLKKKKQMAFSIAPQCLFLDITNSLRGQFKLVQTEGHLLGNHDALPSSHKFLWTLFQKCPGYCPQLYSLFSLVRSSHLSDNMFHLPGLTTSPESNSYNHFLTKGALLLISLVVPETCH
jgi:hypothetical protein